MHCILILCFILFTSASQAKEVESTQYIFPEFTKAEILLKSGKKKISVINYNALTEELVIERRGQKLAIAKEGIADIDTVFVKGRKFILLNEKFTEVLCHSSYDLLVQYKCKIRDRGKSSGYGGTTRTGAIDTHASIVSRSDSYQLKLPDGYEVESSVVYWLRKNGELNKFTSIRELKKIYKAEKDVIKVYVKEHGTKYDDPEGVKNLIEYLETS